MIIYDQCVTEQVNYLDIANPTKHIIYSIPIKVKKDDILQVTSQFEVTNSYNYNVMISSAIIILPTDQSRFPANITCPVAFNVTPNMHHGIVIKARQWKSLCDFEGSLQLTAYAASDNAKSGDHLIVEKGYGHLDVVINRSES